MSQYSEMIGSFIRTGSFPLEADYIFESEASLKEFYNIPENNIILHKGLLKVVADSNTGEQSLWWVTKKQTNDELEFTKLIAYKDIDDLSTKLDELIKKLEQEIQDRIEADDAIWGDTDHTTVPIELNSLKKLAEAIQQLQSDLQEEINRATQAESDLKTDIKAIVGTEENNIVAYLRENLDYKSMKELSDELHRFLQTRNSDNPTIETFPELLDFLDGFTDSDVLKAVLDKLVLDIMGDPLPTEPFRTLRGIEDFVREFKSQSENTDANLQSELDQTQVGVGLSGDGSYNADQETYYLKEATSVMNALKTLDGLMYEALKGLTIVANNDDVVDITVDKTDNGYEIGAELILSPQTGNQLLKNKDGLYYNLVVEYDKGTITVKANGYIISQFNIGVSSLVQSAKYDQDTESIIINFRLLDGTINEVVIPVGTLIREWEVDNSQPSKVVELTREEVYGGGADKLSADVRITDDKYNILTKSGNSLLVRGTADNIVHNDVKVSEVLDSLSNANQSVLNELNAHITDYNNPHQVTKEQVGLGNVDNTSDLDKPISTATQKALDDKAPIDSPILTGVPQVETSPDLDDSSQRIPSTNWVNQKIEESINNMEIILNHIINFDNPHHVTAEQVGAYTKEQINTLLAKKADLVDGKVPKDQLPDCSMNWIEV